MTAPSHRIVWTNRAIADLVALRAYTAERDPAAATRLAQRLIEAAEGIAAHPGVGRAGRWPHSRELYMHKTPYILPYRVGGGVVEILAVIHGARAWPTK